MILEAFASMACPRHSNVSKSFRTRRDLSVLALTVGSETQTMFQQCRESGMHERKGFKTRSFEWNAARELPRGRQNARWHDAQTRPCGQGLYARFRKT